MALPFITILEYLFRAGPVLKAASDIIKKNRKESNQKIRTVEVNPEYKVELLEKKLNEQIRINNDLFNKLDDLTNDIATLKRSFVYIIYLAGFVLLASIIALIVVILK
jgi:hypothetical protein